MEISAYDYSGDCLIYCDRIISAYKEEIFCGVGSGEYHIECEDAASFLDLIDTPLIIEDSDKTQMLVTGYEAGEDFVLYCRTLNHILSKSVLPPFNMSGKISDIVESMVKASRGGAFKLKDCRITKSAAFSSNEALPLSEALTLLLKPLGFGFSLDFSAEDAAFYLSLKSGKNLDFYINEEDGTLDSFTFVKDFQNKADSICYLQRLQATDYWNPQKNSPALSQGKEENFGLCYKVSGLSSPFLRFGHTFDNGDYIYCDNEDGNWKRSISPPEDFYVFIENKEAAKKYRGYHISQKHSQNEAKEELSSVAETTEFSAVCKNLEYKTDFNLGDFAQVQFRLGEGEKTVKCQFAKIILNYDCDEAAQNPILEEVIQWLT